ncbi:rhomboid-like protein [Streptomyces sp. NRRL S-118]|uniref:rhomboid-like protein n=1 Tax=Streptomyces sp. NRRL S-118 TaxID=1463881 RepID=UPI000694CFA0|nr:rhomboid-like protein [Streptomyces sp. NRRL S-118]
MHRLTARETDDDTVRPPAGAVGRPAAEARERLLHGIPRQRPTAGTAAVPTPAVVPVPAVAEPPPVRPAAQSAAAPAGSPAGPRTRPPAGLPAAARPAAAAESRRRWWRATGRLLPTPAGAPFTFGYTLVLVATSLFARYGDPATVSALLHGSSTDVAHLSRTPMLVLGASALWVAGGLFSPYAVGFVFVLTALERRIGAWRAAAVFLVGHVVATLATEIPVALSVLAGHLPGTSLHRLDYGISFGLMASVGALAGLLSPVARAIVLAWVSVMLLQDLLAFEDPLTDWGHPLALLTGVSGWPLLRRAALPGCRPDERRAPGP